MEQKLSVYRSELKFLIDAVVMEQLNMELQQFLIPDIYSTNGGYRVKSLYFDTINNLDFYDKVNGEDLKKKVRLRTYDEKSNKLKLELKEKIGSLQHKTSLVINHEEAQALMNEDYGFLLSRDEQDAVRMYSILRQGLYKPVTMIEYNRRAFIYPEYNTRITLDSEVKYSEANLNIFDSDINYNYALIDDMILEVKYDKILKKFIKKILANKKLTNVSYSKYEWCRPCLQR